MALIPWKHNRERNVPVKRAHPESSPASFFRSELDRLFDNFFNDPFVPNAFGSGGDMQSFSSWLPPVDVSEDEKQIAVSMEVPGIVPKDVDISLSGTTLIVEGTKQEERDEEGETFHVSERSFGTFRRAIELPSDIDPDSVAADYRNGVLRITVRKTGESKRRKIPVYS